jgi:hypothetical protein
MEGNETSAVEAVTEFMRELQRAELSRIEKERAEAKASLRDRMRDHFAAVALNGLLAGKSPKDEEGLAVKAYEIADAMLAERERRAQGIEHSVPPNGGA